MEIMMVTLLSAIVFAGVLSAYIFLGRGLIREGNEEQLESRSRLALYYFTQDVSSASAVTSFSTSQVVLTTVIGTPSTYPAASVTGTATYSYIPDPSNPGSGLLTLTRTTSASAAQLGLPNWPTPSGVTYTVLLKNVQLFSFAAYDIAGNSTTNPLVIKQLMMSFTTSSLSPASGAQAILSTASPRVILKNKPVSLQ